MNYRILENVLDGFDFSRMREQSGLGKIEVALLDTAIDNSLFTLSAHTDNTSEIVGMIRIVGDGAFVFLIYDVLVIPEHRSRGVGTMLIDAALRKIESSMPKGMWVTVNLFAAQGKEEFYKKLGFCELPTTNFGAGMQKMFKAGS